MKYDTNFFCKHYDEVRHWTLRLRARHIALTAASVSWALSGMIRRSLERPRVHFIYFHHVFRDEEEHFEKLVRDLSSSHYFLSYSDAVERIRRGPIDRPYLCFSFDDGLRSCLQAGQILKSYGASACFFVCPTMAEERDYLKIRQFCADRLQMPPTEFLNWDEIERLVQMGHEVGSHTMSHRRMSDLNRIELDEELGRSREALERRLGGVHHFAWPFGQFGDVSQEAVERVFLSGYESCASAERGAHVDILGRGAETNLCIRRDHAVAAWPLSHTLMLMARSSRRSDGSFNRWPDALRPTL